MVEIRNMVEIRKIVDKRTIEAAFNAQKAVTFKNSIGCLISAKDRMKFEDFAETYEENIGI